MSLHVDMTAQEGTPFPAAVLARLAGMQAAHRLLPRPEAAGRRVAMPESRPESSLARFAAAPRKSGVAMPF